MRSSLIAGLAVATLALPAGGTAADAPGSARQTRLLADLNGFAALARTTGGLGRRGFVVDRVDDGLDPGTLRAAVLQATREGGGWIEFAPALRGKSIQLTAPIRLPANVTLDGGSGGPTLIGAPGQTILVITRVANVIVANLTMRSDLTGAVYKGNGDCISVAHGADRIWIAHNLIGRCGDGQLDITQNGEPGRMRVTVAFNHFTPHDKVAIVQGNDVKPCDRPAPASAPRLDVTFYRNFFDGTGQRHPRAGGSAYVHWIENVVQFRPQARTLTGTGGAYGAAVTDGAAMLVERSLYSAGTAGPQRFVDTRPIAAGPDACVSAGKLRTRRLVTSSGTPVAEQQPDMVPDPPYAIPARGRGDRLQPLFAGVMAEAGPTR